MHWSLIGLNSPVFQNECNYQYNWRPSADLFNLDGRFHTLWEHGIAKLLAHNNKKNKENRQNYYSWKYIRNVQDVCLNKRPLISYCKNAMDQPNDLKREAFYTKVITLGAEKYFKYDIKNYVDIGGCLKTAEAASICITLLIIHSPIE